MSFRVSKPRDKKPAFLRSSSSSSKGVTRRAPQLKRAATETTDGDDWDERLDDIGLVNTLGESLNLQDVLQAVEYAKQHMFDEFPEQRSGMNGTRTAEVLQFRRHLPSIVTNAHVHALINSPTQVEKEIGQLVAAGKIRRMVVPGRGVGASAISDALVLVADWTAKVEASNLSHSLKQKYLQRLGSEQNAATFTNEENTALVQAGFLTSAVSLGSAAGSASVNIKDLSSTAISIHNIARAASGSLDATGGEGAIYRIGGGGSAGLRAPNQSDDKSGNLRMSMPNVGAYLKLLQSAREHFLSLLSRSRYSEAPMYLLKERWDGGITTKNPYGRSKDPFKMILPGKTRKWKEFYGLNFDWVLAECLGGGLIEVFNTRSVGLGVRLT